MKFRPQDADRRSSGRLGHTRSSRTAWRSVAVAAAAASVLVVGACSSPSDSGSGGDGAGDGSFALPDSAAQALDAVLQPVSDFPGPEDGVTPPANAKITVITCSATGEQCVRVADGVQDAAKILGWDVNVVDGKGQPATWNAAMSEAIASQADGIVLAAVPPALVGDGMAAAKSAGIPVVFDLGLEAQGADVLVTPDRPDHGKLLADFIARDSGGKGSVLLLRDPEFPDLEAMDDAFEAELKSACPDCTIADTQTFTLGGMAQELSGIVQTSLQTNPDVTYVFTPFDAASTFVNQGIRAAGASDIKVIGTGGDGSSITSLKSGELYASMGVPAEWMGFQSVDALARIFTDAEVPEVPVVQGLITQDNIDEQAPDGTYDGGFDYVSAYKKVWGK